MSNEHIHFVTGRLAEHSLRKMVAALAKQVGFDYSIEVLNITVAALMSPAWIAKRIHVPTEATKVMIPGYCGGDISTIQQAVGVPVEVGPRDLRELPDCFGEATLSEDYGSYDIQIIAEINHVPQLSLATILKIAQSLRDDGADIIDVGCDSGPAFAGVAEVVRALRDSGHRVSIDSLNPAEIAPAVSAGAELVLSVNATNREAAVDWGCEVVAISDRPGSLDGLDETLEFLDKNKIHYRVDPILEPIGFGFANSLSRYHEIRQRYPQAEMMMGIGNITELTDADSSGINVLLLGYCQELKIRSVLTTQVINWAQTSVRECDLARRLVYHAVDQHVLPKRVEPKLVTLRDTKLIERDDDELEILASGIKDHNFRIFIHHGEIHLIGNDLHLHHTDPFQLFDHLQESIVQAANLKSLDASHAFYLGYEMCKAATALTLGKNYEQDESLDWGYLTQQEVSHRLQKNTINNKSEK